MSFLQSTFQLRETSGNMNMDEPGQETENTIDENNGEPPLAASAGRIYAARVSSIRKCDTDPFEREVIDVLKSNVEQSTEIVDPDVMFFLSKFHQVKLLSPSDKLDFQVKFMQLLRSYTSKTHAPSLSSPSTPISNLSFKITAITYPSCSTSETPSVGSNLGSDDDKSILSCLTL